MRLFAGILAPFGWFAAIYGVVLVFPLILAAIGTCLLVGYSRIARGVASYKTALLIWAVSLVFNLVGVVSASALTHSPMLALWGVWPVIASLLSLWGLTVELNDARPQTEGG